MNVLLSSVGRRAYLVRYFQDALHGSGVVVATNLDPNSVGMLAADRAFAIPAAQHADFVDLLLSVCVRNEVGLLCSLHDWETPFIAAAAERFSASGVIAVVASTATIDTCLDKFATYTFGLDCQIRVPATALGIREAEDQVRAGRLAFPLVMKPRRGQGSIFIETVHDMDELRAAGLLASRKMSRTQSNEMLGSSIDESLIIQERIAGPEYGLDILNDLNGRFVTCFVKRKLGMRCGETDAAETVDDPALADFGRRIGERLGHVGILDVDVLVDEDGPCLLEMNPRFGGHYPFAHEAGANVPAALLAWAEGREPEPSWLQAKPGVRSIKDIALRRA